MEITPTVVRCTAGFPRKGWAGYWASCICLKDPRALCDLLMCSFATIAHIDYDLNFHLYMVSTRHIDLEDYISAVTSKRAHKNDVLQH